MTRRIRLQPIMALIGLVILSPVMLVVAGLVMSSLGTPVLFRQMRSGRSGVPFRMIKFRTMRELRDERGALLPDEARTTGIGRFLRRSRLDELPELLNVVAGDMNLVGPRPLLPETIAEMGEGGVVRGAVRPGLTGLAQVSGNTLLARDEKLALDTWYIRNRSWLLDWRIALRTIAVVIAGERRVGS